jgi:TonB family protein
VIRPPNTRVQRTRSSPSALREPLMRHPLGHAAMVLLAAAMLVSELGCSSSAPQPQGEPGARQVLSYQSEDGVWHQDTALVKAPVLMRHVDPGLPESRSDAVSGTVGLKILVAKSGSVLDVVVTKSLSPQMDEQAIKAVRRWEYQPAVRANRPVAVWLAVTVSYSLS